MADKLENAPSFLNWTPTKFWQNFQAGLRWIFESGGGPQPANFVSFNLPIFQLQPANFSAPTCQLFTDVTFTKTFLWYLILR